MKCPFCSSGRSQVLESREVDDGVEVRRRRECLSCEKRFTTVESVKGNALWVIKKDGRREQWDREKVKRGILRAVEKRPVTTSKVEEAIDQIEREMLRMEEAEIPTKAIGGAVLRKLRKLDKVAWLRFASVYLEFTDLKDFKKAIRKTTEK